jgi:hypothetical protein
VTAANGAILPGDPITTSDIPGVGMKATASARVIGYALNFWNGPGEGVIQVFVRPGQHVEATEDVATFTQSTLLVGTVTADIDMAGYRIRTSGGIAGINDIWTIDGDGRFKNRETYATGIQTDTGEVEVFAQMSPKVEITFSGEGQLMNGVAGIVFPQEIRNIISGGTPIRVSVTLTGDAKGVYVTDKSIQGFMVRELQGGTSNATFDWFVVARRKGYDDPAPGEVFVPPAEETPVPEDIVIVDSDTDGLPDSEEGTIGTDETAPDTDGDSYSDGTEVMNGYDPLSTPEETVIEPTTESVTTPEAEEPPTASEDPSGSGVDGGTSTEE